MGADHDFHQFIHYMNFLADITCIFFKILSKVFQALNNYTYSITYSILILGYH